MTAVPIPVPLPLELDRAGRCPRDRAAGPLTRSAGLTTQERQIAELAASGLSNREIGVRLFLSHRTVSSHLHRIFPKLAVATRAGLRDALAALDAPVCSVRCADTCDGMRLPGGRSDAAARLTTQEYEVALLAATGLTNLQIAERLFVSPRTVAVHLYRAFPKLGITSRAALRDALEAPAVTGETKPVA